MGVGNPAKRSIPRSFSCAHITTKVIGMTFAGIKIQIFYSLISFGWSLICLMISDCIIGTLFCTTYFI